MLILSIVLGGLGISSLLMKRSFTGVLVGVHLLFTGAASAFVLSGMATHQVSRGYVFALFVGVVGLCQLILGWALALRLYYLGGTASMNSLRRLKG